MADTPNPTDLADRLGILHQHMSPGGRLRNCTCPVCPDLRSAAAELRRLAADNQRLRNAIKAHLDWTIREQGAEPSDTELALWALIEEAPR